MSNIPNRLRHQITFLCLLLSGILGCGGTETSGVPVRVLIPGPLTMQDTAELELSLGKQKFQPIRPTKSDSSLIVDLPPGSTGELTVKLTLKDADGCVSRGQATVQVSPLATKVAEARIVIDSQSFPVCQLQVGIEGAGQVDVVTSNGTKTCLPTQGSGKPPCEYPIKKGSTVTLRASETLLDSDFRAWRREAGMQDSSRMFRAYALSVMKPETVTATFRKRSCGIDGLCLPEEESAEISPVLFSANGNWGVDDDGNVRAWDSDKHQWQRFAQRVVGAMAIWGVSDRAWLVTREGKVVFFARSQPGTATTLPINGPPERPVTALLSYGGHAQTPEFWMIDRQYSYRCQSSSCQAESLSGQGGQLNGDRSQLLSLFRASDASLVAAWIEPVTDSTCVYKSRTYSGKTPSAESNASGQCLDPGLVRIIRAQGASRSFWAYAPAALFHFDGTNLQRISTKNIFRPLRAVQTDASGPTWLLQAPKEVVVATKSMTSINTDFRSISNGPADQTLRGLWLDSMATAWVVGSGGTFLSCKASGVLPACSQRPSSLKDPTLVWDVVSGDAGGTVWAVNASWRRIECPPDTRRDCVLY